MGGTVRDQVLDTLEDELRDIEAAWIDAEFDAMIAANWEAEPPPPPKMPRRVDRRWNNNHRRLNLADVRRDQARPRLNTKPTSRQRSPPAVRR